MYNVISLQVYDAWEKYIYGKRTSINTKSLQFIYLKKNLSEHDYNMNDKLFLMMTIISHTRRWDLSNKPVSHDAPVYPALHWQTYLGDGSSLIFIHVLFVGHDKLLGQVVSRKNIKAYIN